MHFSKTYSSLLLSLPHELQSNAIQYRQLKKLINGIVKELASLGLSPDVLKSLFDQNELGTISSTDKGKQRAFGERPAEDFGDLSSSSLSSSAEDVSTRGASSSPPQSHTKAVYEVVQNGEHLQPRLRIWIGPSSGAYVEDEEGRTGVDIKLDKPDSPVERRRPLAQDTEEPEMPKEEMLLVSKPILPVPGQSLVWSLQRKEPRTTTSSRSTSESKSEVEELPIPPAHPVELVKGHMRSSLNDTRELIIPLVSDTAFFELLYSALETLASHLLVVRTNFINDLQALSTSISHTAIPESARIHHSYFIPSSHLGESSTPVSPFSTSFIPGGKSRSDLYAWRDIIQLYVESEVFESMREQDRGERDIAETEKRLTLFAERVTGRGLSDGRKLKLKESRDALETFLQLNVLIVNLKKFQFANAEAARKILKKHAKRTALPFPIPRLDSASSPTNSKIFSLLITGTSNQPQESPRNLLALIPSAASYPGATSSLAHLLVQAIGDVLLPIIPHVDDYACLICFSLAFKPIRLSCGHLFCVRCLVKMQKRGQDGCPCCRTPCVLRADRSNVDWAMLNFMQDWFPREAAAKTKQNEREAAKEELDELGFTDHKCIIC